jgi:hypothetical protein
MYRVIDCRRGAWSPHDDTSAFSRELVCLQDVGLELDKFVVS